MPVYCDGNAPVHRHASKSNNRQIVQFQHSHSLAWLWIQKASALEVLWSAQVKKHFWITVYCSIAEIPYIQPGPEVKQRGVEMRLAIAHLLPTLPKPHTVSVPLTVPLGKIDSQKLFFVFLMYDVIVNLTRRCWKTEQGNQNNQAFTRKFGSRKRGCDNRKHRPCRNQKRGIQRGRKNNETILSTHRSDQKVVVYNAKLKRLVTTLLCVRHASYWWTEPLHVKQRWGTVPRVHYHSRLTWHCFSKDWLPGPLQLEVNRQFSISREHGFISKSRGDGGR